MSNKTEGLIEVRTERRDCGDEILFVKPSAITSIHLYQYQVDKGEVFWFVSINNGEFTPYYGKNKKKALIILHSIINQLLTKTEIEIWSLDLEKENKENKDD